MHDQDNKGKELRLRIGGVVVSVLAPLPYTVDELRFPFLTSDPPDLVARLHVSEPPFSVGSIVRSGIQDGWALYRVENGRAAVSGDNGGFGSDYTALVWNEENESLDLYRGFWNGDWQRAATIFYVFRLPLIHAISRRRGAVIHACAISVNGTGLVFPGPQGVGKSTLAHLWDASGQASILHDDACVVREIDGQVSLSGVPWLAASSFSRADQVPLRAVFFLAHGVENRCTRLTPVQSLRFLLPQVYTSVLFGPSEVSKLRETCLRLVEQIPCFHLAFVPDESALDLIVREAGI